jgi:hypothetical protein
LARLELHAGAIVRLPHEATLARRLFAVDQDLERRRNPDEAIDLQTGPFGRQIPDHAVEHRPPVVEQYLAAPERAGAV